MTETTVQKGLVGSYTWLRAVTSALMGEFDEARLTCSKYTASMLPTSCSNSGSFVSKSSKCRCLGPLDELGMLTTTSNCGILPLFDPWTPDYRTCQRRRQGGGNSPTCLYLNCRFLVPIEQAYFYARQDAVVVMCGLEVYKHSFIRVVVSDIDLAIRCIHRYQTEGIDF